MTQPNLQRAILFPSVGLLVAAVLAGFVTFAVIPAQFEEDAFLQLFARYDPWLALLQLVVLLLAFRFAPGVSERRTLELLEAAGHRAGWLAAATALVFALVAPWIYQRFPLAMDEVAPVFQAEVFAAGEIKGEYPPQLASRMLAARFHGAFFNLNHKTGEIVSNYWPGFALLLTPFAKIGAPWLLNPLLSGVGLWLSARIARRFGGEVAAGWVMLLLLASPVYWALGISFYSMQAHLVLNLLFAELLIAGGAARLAAAGAVGSLAACLNNPFPHLLFALPWWVSVARRPRPLVNLSPLGAGYLPGVLFLGVGWMLLRGSVVSSAADGLAADLGYLTRARDYVFALPDLSIMGIRAVGFLKIAIWSAPCALALAWLLRARKGNPSDGALRLLWASILLTLVGYFVVAVDQGHGWGYRYFHSAFGALVLLAAIGLARRTCDSMLTSRFAMAAVLSACLVVPASLAFVHHFIQVSRSQIPEPSAFAGREVVFVNTFAGHYVQDLIRNSPFGPWPRLILETRGPLADAQLAKALDPNLRLVERSSGGVFEVWRSEPTGLPTRP